MPTFKLEELDDSFGGDNDMYFRQWRVPSMRPVLDQKLDRDFQEGIAKKENLNQNRAEKKKKHGEKFEKRLEELTNKMSQAAVVEKPKIVPFFQKPTETELSQKLKEWNDDYAAPSSSAKMFPAKQLGGILKPRSTPLFGQNMAGLKNLVLPPPSFTPQSTTTPTISSESSTPKENSFLNSHETVFYPQTHNSFNLDSYNGNRPSFAFGGLQGATSTPVSKVAPKFTLGSQIAEEEDDSVFEDTNYVTAMESPVVTDKTSAAAAAAVRKLKEKEAEAKRKMDELAAKKEQEVKRAQELAREAQRAQEAQEAQDAQKAAQKAQKAAQEAQRAAQELQDAQRALEDQRAQKAAQDAQRAAQEQTVQKFQAQRAQEAQRAAQELQEAQSSQDQKAAQELQRAQELQELQDAQEAQKAAQKSLAQSLQEARRAQEQEAAAQRVQEAQRAAQRAQEAQRAAQEAQRAAQQQGSQGTAQELQDAQRAQQEAAQRAQHAQHVKEVAAKRAQQLEARLHPKELPPTTTTTSTPSVTFPYIHLKNYIALLPQILEEKSTYEKSANPPQRSLLKRTVIEKVTVFTQRNTSKEMRAEILEFFKLLLTKKEVEGFAVFGDAPMMELKTDEDVNYAVYCIVEKYISLAELDVELAATISDLIARLSLIVRRVEKVFLVMMLNKCTLLRQNPKECVEKFVETQLEPEDKAIMVNREKALLSLFFNVFVKNALFSSKGRKTVMNEELLWKYCDLTVAHATEIPKSAMILLELITNCKPHLVQNEARWTSLIQKIGEDVIPSLEESEFPGDESVNSQLSNMIQVLLR